MLRSGHSDAPMRIVRRDREARNAGDELGGRLARAEYDRHAAGVLGRLLKPAAMEDHAGRVGKRQNPGGLGGRHLADAVAHRQGRADADPGQRAHARGLDGEKQRLGDVGPGEVGRDVGGVQFLDQRPTGERQEVGIDFRQRVAKSRVRLVGGPAHARPLRPVAGENKHDCAVALDGGRPD